MSSQKEKRSLHGGFLLKPSVLLVFDLMMMLMLSVGQVRVLSLSVTV